ncbi:MULTISPECIES: DUF2507 domain-containing protein [Lactobacillaceae]|uniref:DUF2507 domain-containing protein n=1 Tax=Lactobacillaceae TaxID=33958 RepID=UPI000C1B74A0|nr:MULTISPECIES: DUF2507 domain-containing protein [Lactobacillaceae]
MSENEVQNTEVTVNPAFAISILRDNVIPDLLDNDTIEILYWAGKNLARTLDSKIEGLPTLFKEAGLGDLRIMKQTTSNFQYKLQGTEVAERFDHSDVKHLEYSLEAGLISETIERTISAYCMGTYSINKNDKSVSIKIHVERA